MMKIRKMKSKDVTIVAELIKRNFDELSPYNGVKMVF